MTSNYFCPLLRDEVQTKNATTTSVATEFLEKFIPASLLIIKLSGFY